MSAKQLRAERIAMGVAGVAAAFSALSSTGVARASLVGPIGGPDPFADKSINFPNDLKQIDHWIEFQAQETKGQALDAVNSLLKNAGVNTQLTVGNTTNGGLVRLPMPANVSTDYNPNYTPTDLGLAAGQVLKPADQKIYNTQGPGSLLEGTSLQGMSGSSIFSAGLGSAAGAAVAGVSKAVGNEVFNAATKVTAGVAQNPHKILLFTGVDFRDHRFSWRLSPRSRDESDAINDIINYFTF